MEQENKTMAVAELQQLKQLKKEMKKLLKQMSKLLKGE